MIQAFIVTGFSLFFAASASRVAPDGVDAMFAPARAVPARVVVREDSVADKRPEVEALITKLAGHASKKGSEDRDAVGVIDQILIEFKKSGPKDRAAIVKALSKCFEARRLEPTDGVPQNQMYLAAAVALGEMGPESTKALISWVGHKNHRKDLALQHRLLLSLGRTQDVDGLDTLIYNLENKEATLVSGAAEALGGFADASIEVRKRAFEAMLKTLMSAKGAKDQDINDTTARDRFDVIAAPITTSLGKLAKHEERDPDEWQRWWNKNKRGEWTSGE